MWTVPRINAQVLRCSDYQQWIHNETSSVPLSILHIFVTVKARILIWKSWRMGSLSIWPSIVGTWEYLRQIWLVGNMGENVATRLLNKVIYMVTAIPECKVWLISLNVQRKESGVIFLLDGLKYISLQNWNTTPQPKYPQTKTNKREAISIRSALEHLP